MSEAPAGWYDDGSGQQRWWNGREWSPAGQPVASTGQATGRTKRATWPWVLGGALLLVVALIVGGILLLVSLISGLTTAPGTPSAAVLSYREAFVDEDCDLFISVTTPRFREENELDSCDDFLLAVERSDKRSGAGYTNEEFGITGFRSENSDAVVHTEQSVELDGERLEFAFDYTLVAGNGSWRIDQID